MGRHSKPEPVHTGMQSHDGYAPHSHEVRADHEGVSRCTSPTHGVCYVDSRGIHQPGTGVISSTSVLLGSAPQDEDVDWWLE